MREMKDLRSAGWWKRKRQTRAEAARIHVTKMTYMCWKIGL